MTKNKVNLESNIELYIKDLKNLDVLSKGEERYLINQYQANNSIEAKQKLILHNTRLAFSIANKYHKKYPKNDLLDLVQSGIEGLFVALDKFDLNTTNKFSTYATYWIRQKISRYIKINNNIIRIPEHIQDAVNKYTKEATRIETEENRTATSKEIAENIELNYSMLKKVEQVIQNINAPISLDKKTESFGIESKSIIDYLIDNTKESTESYIDHMDKQILIKDFCKTLNIREKNIVNVVYGIGYDSHRSCEEAGKIFNITRERVRQLLSKAQEKIKREIEKYSKNKTIEYKNIENSLFR